MGNFGKDKVLEYGDGVDILQIGAAREDVWFERLGRRGDELEVTVNDGTHTGTISGTSIQSIQFNASRRTDPIWL